jgi:branched-chain amino acid transport system ATP-binding protein
MLEVSALKVDIGRLHILDDVTLKVGENEVVAVIGANGAGKSTLLRAISGLIPPVAGKVTFQSRDITHLRPHRIVALGLSQIPERGRVFPHMTVFENLVLGAWTRKGSELRSSLSDVFGAYPVLEKRKNQAAGTLSGGERQMLAIARALMGKPKLLLLDEPTLGLAPIMCQNLGVILSGLHKAGASILLVEQNAVLALNVSQRCYVMETGKIVLNGPSKELRSDDRIRKAYLGAE